ncbi:MAG: BatD family protein, partial [Acidobacteriota bacterium]
RSYTSRPFKVRILAASAKPRESEGLFIRQTVSNKNPYVGEQVIYTWRFFHRVHAENAQLITPFEFEGFLVEDLGDVRQYRATRGGQEYVVNEIRKALFPQEQGLFTIPESQLSCQVITRRRGRRGSLFDDIFSRGSAQGKVLTGAAIEVNVRPRPAAPSGFSGLVGDFDIRSSIAKRELQVGESATWKLTVNGTGNVQMIGEPGLPDLSQFKIYDDRPASSIKRDGNELKGSRTFTKAIVPQVSGEIAVPAVDLTYFDPEAGTYRTASTPPILLAVRPAEGKEELRLTESVAPNTGKVAVRILADDILPITKDLDAVAAAPFGHRADPVWLGGLLAPPLLYFGLLFAQRRQRHLAVNVHLVRRRSALKKALKGLGEVGATAQDGRHLEASQAASRLLREYIGDKVGLEGSALTPSEAAEQLRRCEVDEETVEATQRKLEGLEAAQYAGASAADSGDLQAELGSLLKQLEGQIRVGGRR